VPLWVAGDWEREVGTLHIVWTARFAVQEATKDEGNRMTHKYVIGVDESGCGALAGPLIVVAVAFPIDATRVTAMWTGVYADKTLMAGDSKGIKNPAHREALSIAVQATCSVVVVIEKSAAEIDKRLFGTVFPEAIKLAASRCLERLKTLDPTLEPENFLVKIDGDLERPALPCQVQCIANGDKTDWRIGAASIVAKATHDKRIDELHKEYPNWGFDKSRGYPTREHKALLIKRGPTLAHRKSFRPVQAAMPRAQGMEE
jgi:ribonuclease HII